MSSPSDKVTLHRPPFALLGVLDELSKTGQLLRHDDEHGEGTEQTSFAWKLTSGTATYHIHTSARVRELLRLLGMPVFPPMSLRGRWAVSRYVEAPDGSHVSILGMLAYLNQGAWAAPRRPVWTNGDWSDERFGNVYLANIPAVSHSARSEHGPSGTKEYFRQYRLANKEKFKAAQKRYKKRMQEAYRQQKNAGVIGETNTVVTSQSAVDDLILEGGVDPSKVRI
jgi:hypothetical protein